MNNIKQKILDEIEEKVDVFKVVNTTEYRIRCPLCGDSQSNKRDAHCYIHCDIFTNEPILFNCFLCNKGGVVDRKFLNKLCINDLLIDKIETQKFNKLLNNKSLLSNVDLGNPDMNSRQVEYIEHRIGRGLRYDDYKKFKIVWDMSSLYPLVNNTIRNTFPNNMNSISFLSDDKSMLLNRSFDDDISRWRKIRLRRNDFRSFYTIDSSIDIFSRDNIIVNIAEGIFDIISVYKNFNEYNSVFIACLGSNYIRAVDYSVSKGLIGGNVTLKIYIDNGINEKWLLKKLKDYKWLYKSIFVYRNIKSKDVGVTFDNIRLIEKII